MLIKATYSVVHTTMSMALMSLFRHVKQSLKGALKKQIDILDLLFSFLIG